MCTIRTSYHGEPKTVQIVAFHLVCLATPTALSPTCVTLCPLIINRYATVKPRKQVHRKITKTKNRLISFHVLMRLYNILNKTWTWNMVCYTVFFIVCMRLRVIQEHFQPPKVAKISNFPKQLSGFSFNNFSQKNF